MNPIWAKLPAGEFIQSTHESKLPIKGLSCKAKTAHLFPNLQHSLISNQHFAVTVKLTEGVLSEDLVDNVRPLLLVDTN